MTTTPARHLPNFFIVGAPKAGTDSLYYDLDQHPQIYMSPLKEPCYFSSEIRLENFESGLQPQMQLAIESTRQYIYGDMNQKRFGGIVSRHEDYLQLFAGVKQETAIGEGSVCYLWSRSAPREIASAIPHAKIIIILMDPAERAFHQYLKSVSDGSVGHSFEEHIRICFQQPSNALGVFHPFLEFGNYAEQLQRYLDEFPQEQVHISLYEDVKSKYEYWFADILKFLNVNAEFVPDISKRRQVPPVPRQVGTSYALRHTRPWKAAQAAIPGSLKSLLKSFAYRQAASLKMSSTARNQLVAYYRADILSLENIIQRDLSAWTQ
jgi:hypothetical protein